MVDCRRIHTTYGTYKPGRDYTGRIDVLRLDAHNKGWSDIHVISATDCMIDSARRSNAWSRMLLVHVHKT